MRLLVLHIVFSSAIALPTFAGTDLGAIGPTYEIEEDDFSKVIMQKAKQSREDGSWEEAVKRHGEKIDSGALEVNGDLPQARNGKTYLLDPTITVQEPIRRADGTILYDRGTKVNPLDYVSFNRMLCFFDASQPAQIEWIKHECSGRTGVKRIAVQGNITGLNDQLGRVYLDQERRLTERFELKELPSTITRDGTMLRVKVIEL